MRAKLGLAAATAAVAAAFAAGATAAPAQAASQSSVAGARCVYAGVQFLVANDLLRDAALRRIDYDTIDTDAGGPDGPINADLPSGSYLPLGTVIRLHFTNPELFDWCS